MNNTHSSSDNLTVFAVDSSTSSASVAVICGNKTLFSHTENYGLTHSEKLMGLVDEAFKATGLYPSDIDLFAVCHGPGSYTGLRIGVAITKGLAFGISAPCIGISTLKTLAAAQDTGNVIPLINARRGNYFCGGYVADNSSIKSIYEDEMVDAEKICEWFGSEECTLTGDGAELFYNSLPQHKRERFILSDIKMPSCEICAVLAAHEFKKHGGISASELQPVYIKDVYITQGTVKQGLNG